MSLPTTCGGRRNALPDAGPYGPFPGGAGRGQVGAGRMLKPVTEA